MLVTNSPACRKAPGRVGRAEAARYRHAQKRVQGKVDPFPQRLLRLTCGRARVAARITGACAPAELSPSLAKISGACRRSTSRSVTANRCLFNCVDNTCPQLQ
eukprot:1114380-Prorocentrum_minimum.AAC.2